MKILLYSWGEFNSETLKKNLKDLGNDVIVFNRKCTDFTKDMNFAWEMIDLITARMIDAVVSHNYFPIISMVCKTKEIPYYSWIFDSPHHTLSSRTVLNECNHIGCFDRAQTVYYNCLGINTIYHLPFGSDPELFCLTDKTCTCDVSFMGKLYTDDHTYYDSMEIPDDLRKKFDSLILSRKFCYQSEHTGTASPAVSSLETREEKINYKEYHDEIVYLLEKSGLRLGDDEFFSDPEYIFRNSVIDRKITIEERKELVKMLSELDCDFRLYTGSDVSYNPNLSKCNQGYVDYYTQMPSVFRFSKININNTLRSIRSGIPVRALDIMACGGFLLSDRQEELAENFIENEEVVFYYSLNDCKEKIYYYLTHEEERIKIAKAGQKKTLERFSYKDQLRKLLNK